MAPLKNSGMQAFAAMPAEAKLCEAWCSHVPNKGEQMVRYYGYYSSVSRGRRKKANQDGAVPCILESEESSREYRKNWARFIRLVVFPA
ncbi:MAG: hypothetical protein JRJ85_17735 [Deltaproteobacteria bacterium]|nr:hypothetical protein [Deltaproteobacteria bacterium]